MMLPQDAAPDFRNQPAHLGDLVLVVSGTAGQAGRVTFAATTGISICWNASTTPRSDTQAIKHVHLRRKHRHAPRSHIATSDPTPSRSANQLKVYRCGLRQGRPLDPAQVNGTDLTWAAPGGGVRNPILSAAW